jgi:hypothetical protein
MFVPDDGGRASAGLRGRSGDCAVRAVAIAADMPYREAQRLIKEFAAKGKQGNRAIARGVYREDLDAALRSIGWTWHPAPKFKGRKARYTDIPGTAILRMARHFAAVRDGELRDTWDCSQKMVYGYWTKEVA